MKRLPLTGLLLAVSCLLTPVLSAAEKASDAGWSTDYAAALTQAKSENKHVFLFFTGSDWCGWCKKLQAEILTKPEFQSYAVESLILVELDFPNRKKLPDTVVAQNQKLMEQYKIEGFPTVIVLDSSGKKVGELGYQRGGPGPFVEALKKL